MNRFNLTFRGEFLPGQDRERAKLRFAQLFGIDDRTRLDSFFSGRTVILRRNLDRKTAAEYYAKLRELGVHAQLVKVSAPEAANTALRKAENEKRAAERKVARQQAQREAAQQAERERAERGEQQRIAVQQAAQRKAERAERKQQEAREAARRQEQERRRAAEQAAQRAAERERRAAQHREQAAQRRAMEEQAISRGAQALSRQVALKPVSARVKTRLETPRGADRAHDHSDPGAPNLYALQPFRNTPAVRERAAQARQRLRRAVVVAFVASAALLLLAGAYLQRATAPPDMRIAASAVDPGSGPLRLVAGRRLRHDRSGRGTQTIALRDMGLATLQAPLVFDATGYLLAPGRLAAGDPAAAGDASARLLRCDLDQRKCRPVSGELDGRHISGLALHPLSGDLFVADAGAGRIVRIGADGQRLGQAAVPLVQHPALRLAAGLLFTNSVNGPAISVFRYDAAAFGQQLDEILLLPAAMAITEHTRVRDFIRVDGDWWVILYTADPGAATPEGGVFRFDAQGKYLGRIDGPPHSRPRQLLNWAGKVLIRDADATTLQRFSAAGTPEAPLRSDLLQHLHAREQRAAALTALAWHTALIVLLLLTLGAAGTAYLQRARSLVYKSKRERGAEPIDAIAASVRWYPYASASATAASFPLRMSMPWNSSSTV